MTALPPDAPPPDPSSPAGSGSEPARRQVLVVDDDARLRDLLQRYLSQNGFEVTVAADAHAMNRLLPRRVWDLMVLDVMMPGEDGLAVVRRLRSAGDMLPIILLTARTEDVDRIIGLEMGADDYLGKPFNPRELLARMHAVLRRKAPSELAAAPSQVSGNLRFGPFVFEPSQRRLTRDGQTVELTSGEFALLKVFAAHPRQPMSRDKLMQLTRGREYGAFDRSLDVQVSRLRKLIEVDPAHPRHVQTVWGIGYVFVPD